MIYNFSISLVKSVVYIISFFILIPLFIEPGASLYASLFVYSASKSIDYYERVLNDCDKVLHILHLLSVFGNISVVVISFTMMANGSTNVFFTWLIIIVAGLTCAIDCYEVAWNAVKHYRTKQYCK